MRLSKISLPKHKVYLALPPLLVENLRKVKIKFLPTAIKLRLKQLKWLSSESVESAVIKKEIEKTHTHTPTHPHTFTHAKWLKFVFNKDQLHVSGCISATRSNSYILFHIESRLFIKSLENFAMKTFPKFFFLLSCCCCCSSLPFCINAA